MLLTNFSRSRFRAALVVRPSQFNRIAAIGALGSEGEKLKRSKKDCDNKVVAVLNFQGDIKAKERGAFSKLVDEIEVNAEEIAEVVVCVESGGGAVPRE